MKSKIYDRVTSLIIEKLESGVVPWQKSWGGECAELGTHINKKTGKPYRGINAILTYMMGFDSNEWLTFNQAREMGGKVRKGEKGLPIIFWSFPDEKKDSEKEKDSTEEEAKRPFAKSYTVFNIRQIEGIDQPVSEEFKGIDFEPIEKAESIVSGYEDAPSIEHGFSSAAYRLKADQVIMPEKNNFHSVEEYYSTLFHELVHSTGAEERLKRKSLLKSKKFGDHAYSKEELVAEIGSAFLCSLSGISPKVHDNQAAYIKSWLEAFKNDSTLIVQASQQAQKAAEYINGQAMA